MHRRKNVIDFEPSTSWRPANEAGEETPMRKTEWIVMAVVTVLVAAGGAVSAFAGNEAPPTTSATTNVRKK
jgi:hypothetical protein